ncbi:MAG: MurNAc alpha-1-phosphate uridylyltransferase [Candidatus Endobugula sp.]|jgi:MurNAc alpha-1-phosphate uridylyltransferase
MKAMILAAGRGERMRPLTDDLPKPLLAVGGKPLIVYHLEKFSSLGVTDVIINVAYLGDKIQQVLGDGTVWGLSIHYSKESYPLETGGALYKALPLLGDEPFILVNGDVWSDIDFSDIAKTILSAGTQGLSVGHLFCVENPAHNPQGDFSLDNNIVTLKDDSASSYTFSGMAFIHPDIIRGYPNKREAFPLKEAFLYFIEQRKLTASIYSGGWCDVGTPERLQELEVLLKSS